MQIDTIDLNDLDVFERGFPHDAFTALRSKAPVWWHPGTELAPGGEGFWVVLDHAHVRAVSRDARTYSSETGGGRAGGGTILEDLPLGTIVGAMLNMSDGAAHARMRSLVSRTFTPRALERLEGDLRARTKAILDRVTPRGECDFVADVARELPLQVIANMLGVPQSDRHALFEDASTVLKPTEPGDQDERARAGARMRAYGQRLVEEKQRSPDDSMLSAVIHPPAGQPGMSQTEIENFFSLLWAAGSDTTRNAISGCLVALVDRPADVEALRSDPGLWPTAIEELLRFSSPVTYNRRTATVEATLAGNPIRPGDKVTIWYPSANRDESVFADAHELDVRRHPNPHLAFNIGEHVCLGANLARRELRIMLEQIVGRWTDIELTGPVGHARSNKHGTIDRVPIRFRARRG